MTRSSIRSAMVVVTFSGAFAGAVALDASSSGQQATPQAKVNTVIVTGCIATGASAGQYILSNAAVEGEASASPNIMHSAPAADMSKDGKPVSYPLMGGELQPHVGHKVAITGTMDDAKPGQKSGTPVGSAGSSATAAASGDRATPMPDGRVLHVQSVKMVASSCS
jgi:hypothetical protein